MAAEAIAERRGEKPVAQRLPISAPMLDEASFDAQGNRIFAANYSADRWILDGHRTKSGQALIPGTGYIELGYEALRAQGESGAFALRDLYFFRPLDVADGARRDIRVRLVRNEEGYAVEVRSAITAKGRTGWQLHAQARAVPVAQVTDKIDVLAIAGRLPAAETGSGLHSPQEAHLQFGPRWRVLNSRSVGADEGLARLALPKEFAVEAGEWLLHPALMDLATGWAMDLIPGYQPDHLWVPVSYAKIHMLRPLPAEIVSWVRRAGTASAQGSTATFDVTLASPNGDICVEIEGFSIHRLEGGLKFSAPDPRELDYDDDAASKPLSPAEERLMHSFTMGIRPEEGAQAFGRAVAMGSGQIIVSSLDLPALIRQTTEAEAAKTEGKSFERPDLDTDYVAPRNDVERTLVGFWQELLGVSQVGIEDSFFDLGGHSLIAVRLFAMVKKAYRVDFPISVLFEAPTIARCADLIIAQIGEPGSDAPTKIAQPTRRFTHIVPMHQGEGGSKKPFFLVAGMGGNVLNLRHMAQILGRDRPFYGLQARGLLGDVEPHTDFVTAARDYIAELRQIQPQGPYLLGGYSGGGLTAWEMARQLEAEGETVSLLALLDTPLPMRPVVGRLDKALIKLADLRSKGPAFLLEWARNRWEWEKTKRIPKVDIEGEAQFQNVAIEMAFRQALAIYDVPKRAGATVLYRPPLDLHWKVSKGMYVSEPKEYVYNDNDLTRFAARLEVVEVPGDHDSMVLEPNVRVLAAHLREAIATAEGPTNVVALSTAAE